ILPPTPIPALLTSTLSPPSCSRAASTATAQSSGSVTSCALAKAVPLPQLSLIASAVSAAPPPLRSVHSTPAPSSASRRACAAPRPCAAPVTSASLPAPLPAISALSDEAARQQHGDPHVDAVPQRAPFGNEPRQIGKGHAVDGD